MMANPPISLAAVVAPPTMHHLNLTIADHRLPRHFPNSLLRSLPALRLKSWIFRLEYWCALHHQQMYFPDVPATPMFSNARYIERSMHEKCSFALYMDALLDGSRPRNRMSRTWRMA